MQNAIRWGILGPGRIARKFAAGLGVLDDAALVAVGSRSQENADRFGDEFHVPRRHASYEALAEDPEVDAVYVATPHPFHKANSILCLEAGKAVLCEKPFTINAREAAEVIAVARERGVFLMEAMWTRFIPAIVKVREWLAAGAIGEVRMLAADFGFRGGRDPKGRLFNPELGGGALLDVGIYPVSLASMVFGGPPERIVSLAHLGETGVDEEAGIVFRHEGGRIAVLHTAISVTTSHSAHVMGTGGSIEIAPPFWKAERVVLRTATGEERVELPLTGNGYNYEAAEVMDCLRAGRTESNIMPLDETLAIMKTLDTIRQQWGLTYPMERRK